MELLNSLKLYIIFFITCDMLLEFVCQSDDLEGKCWDEYRAEIVSNGHQGNVLYVCTDSPLSNVTNTVYMDMSRVPRFINSTCYCTVTFIRERKESLYSVRLDYWIESSTDALNVNGYGFDRFSTQHSTHVIDTVIKDNNVTFTLTSPGSDFKSCLRITSEASESFLRVQCYSNLLTPVADTSSSTNTWTTPTSTTPVADTSSPTKTWTTPTSTTPVVDTSSSTNTWTTPTSTTPVVDTSSSTNTWTTPTSTKSAESTIETGLGSTLSQITDTSTGSENNGPSESNTGSENNGHSGAVIGGAIGGGLFLVIVTVIAAVLVLKRRKMKTDQRKNDNNYINEIGLNNVGNVTTDSANEGTYETPVANSVNENKYETLTANSADGTNYETLVANSVDENKYETLTANSADGTNYETLVANTVDENKYEVLAVNSTDGNNYKTPVARSADEYKYTNIAGQSTDESKYENVTENDNFSAKSTNNKAYVNEDVIQSIKK